MNTTKLTSVPILPITGGYEFVLEDLELAFPKGQLKRITKDWDDGENIQEIADKIHRHPDEVFLALFHQARKNKIKRPFAYQVKKPVTKYKKGSKYKAVVEVEKLKKGSPSVIEIDGKRYVYDPE